MALFDVSNQLALVIYALQVGTPTDNYLTALAICIGLFVIIITLIEWGTSSAVKADRLHRNAEELNAFQRKLGQRLSEAAEGHPCTAEQLDALREEYEETKARCPFNHEPVDNLLFLVERRRSPEFLDGSGKPTISRAEGVWITICSSLSAIWYFGLFWVVIFVLLWLTPWKPG